MSAQVISFSSLMCLWLVLLLVRLLLFLLLSLGLNKRNMQLGQRTLSTSCNTRSLTSAAQIAFQTCLVSRLLLLLLLLLFFLLLGLGLTGSQSNSYTHVSTGDQLLISDVPLACPPSFPPSSLPSSQPWPHQTGMLLGQRTSCTSCNTRSLHVSSTGQNSLRCHVSRFQACLFSGLILLLLLLVFLVFLLLHLGLRGGTSSAGKALCHQHVLWGERILQAMAVIRLVGQKPTCFASHLENGRPRPVLCG